MSVLVASLSGAEEVPPVLTEATGFVTIILDAALGEICWELSVSNLSGIPTAALIQNAPAGANGPAVFPLTPPPPQTGTVSGCGSATPALINAILNNPELYYVNVHTTVFPAGEIRGQLSAPAMRGIALFETDSM